MEVKNNPGWLNESHPNFLRWKLARELSIERGKFVYSIVNQKVNSNNLSVLDLGSGEGGTSEVFSQNNFVISLDISLIRLHRQDQTVNSAAGIPSEEIESSSEKSSTINKDRLLPSLEVTKINCVNGSALQLPFSNHSFDLIIIQDVIEHLTNVSDLYSEVKRVLKINGSIYLSTPNKFSIINILNDPHFGLPVVSILKRKSIKKYFLKHFRKDDYNRSDIAQLFSLYELLNLFKKDFGISLHTNFSVKELFNGNNGIVWSDFHLKLIALCKIIKLDKMLIKIANDKIGVINKFFTPTFYFILNRTGH